MHATTTLTRRQLHNQIMDSLGQCPDEPGCPFCEADRVAGERERGDYSSDRGLTEYERNTRLKPL